MLPTIRSQRALAAAMAEGTPKYFTRDEVRAILTEDLRARDHASWFLVALLWGTGARVSEAMAVTLALHTGMRQGEILALEWADIDMARGVLTVRKSKNGDKRGIPLSATATDAIKQLRQGRKVVDINGRVFPITRSSVRQAYLKAVSRAGIADFRFHDLRHTFATRLVQGGVDLYRVQTLLGHRNVSMTTRYSHHGPESLRSSVETLDRAARG